MYVYTADNTVIKNSVLTNPSVGTKLNGYATVYYAGISSPILTAMVCTNIG